MIVWSSNDSPSFLLDNNSHIWECHRVKAIEQHLFESSTIMVALEVIVFNYAFHNFRLLTSLQYPMQRSRMFAISELIFVFTISEVVSLHAHDIGPNMRTKHSNDFVHKIPVDFSIIL